MKYESEGGWAFQAQAAAQMNIRIGSMPSMLHPKMIDATIPVWTSVEMISPPDKVLGDLYQMQSAPENIAGLIALCKIAGAICSFLGLTCIGIMVCRWRKQSNYRKKVAVETVVK